MFLANLEVSIKLLVDICNFIIFREDKVDFRACFIKMSIESSSFLFFDFPLFTEKSPFLLLSRKLLDFFFSFILYFLPLKFLASNQKDQLLTVFLLF